MSACTMKSTTPRMTQRFLPAATMADFLKNICATPSMIDARMTRATPKIASATGGIAVLRPATDEPHASQNQDDADDLQCIQALAHIGDRDHEHGNQAEGRDGLRVGKIGDLEYAQPVPQL